MYIKIGKTKYDIVIAKKFRTRLWGLIGKKDIDYGMLFPNCNSIHTFMMKENIDVVGLDLNNEVIYKYENLGKNQVIKVNNPQNKTSILELPQNASKKLKIGQILIFEEDNS